jgi:phosphomannomutase
MDAVSRATVAASADLGVIFDTDCDRAALVGPDGSPINRNRLIALMSAVVLEQYPGGTIVTDSITSSGLADFITGLGGVHHRFRRGYNNVIREARRLEAAGVSAPMAIETSGHCALRENRFLDDGAYLVTRLLIRMAACRRQGGKLLDLISGLREPVEEVELRLGVADPDFAAYGQRVLNAVLRRAGEDGAWTPAPENHEGVRVSFGPGDGDGWFLLRLSLHDPVLPLNIESDVKGGTRIIAGKLRPLLEAFDRLDLTALRNYLDHS